MAATSRNHPLSSRNSSMQTFVMAMAVKTILVPRPVLARPIGLFFGAGAKNACKTRYTKNMRLWRYFEVPLAARTFRFYTAVFPLAFMTRGAISLVVVPPLLTL
jgi:hypothetical protein